MSEETGVDVSKMKPTIVIGFGGTGIKTLLKLKKLVSEKAPKILEKNKLICLGLDTAKWQESSNRDPVTGVELQNGKEYIDLAWGVDIDEWVKSEFTANLKNESDDGIAPHWPVINGMCYDPAMGGKITNGAAQNRPVGRACVFNSAAALIERLKGVMLDFETIAGAGSVVDKNPTVHFIGSIAGGTGSSMIYDIPYITRIICGKTTYKAFAHFPMANVFLNDLTGGWEKTRCRANTWTALTEMDHWNRLFISDPATAHWKVNYGFDCGTIRNGEPTSIAKQRPIDVTFLYHDRNTGGHVLPSAEPLYEVIAQAIGYIVMGDLIKPLDDNLVNVKNETKRLNSKGKARCYSSLGVATLDLPVERLKSYMGYKWAGQLALDKCAADVNAPKEEYESKKWKEYGELLEKVFGKQFPVQHKTDDNKWEDTSSGDLKEQWGELAERYGLKKLDLDIDRKITAKILDGYDDRIPKAKNYYKDCETEEAEYEKRQQQHAKETLEEVKQGIKEYMTGVMTGGRSTDALVFAAPLVVRAIGRVDQLLSEIQQSIQGSEARLAEQCIADNRLKDSPFFSSARETQVKGWVRDCDQYWSNKADSDRVVRLRGGLKEIGEYLEEMKMMVHEADKTAEMFEKDFESRAEGGIQDAISDESTNATCEYLVAAKDYPKFIEQFSYKDSAESIFKSINERITREMDGISLLEALGSESKSNREKAKKIWYEECAEVAESHLSKAKLADHIAKVTEENGNDEHLKDQLKKLVSRAGPWMQHSEAILGTHPMDQLVVYQYLIYPEGADFIKELFMEMEADSVFDNIVRAGDTKTKCVPGRFGQSIVRLSMIHCYSLETLDFLSAERAADEQMRKVEERYASGTLRTIFKDNVMQPYMDPTEERREDAEIVLNPEDYETCLTCFMLAHVMGVLRGEYDPIKSTHKWKLDHTEGVLGGAKKAVTTVLPPEDIRIRMNQPEQGNQDAQVYSGWADRWSMSHERNDAAVKLGCFIAQTPSYYEALGAAQTKKWEEGGAEGYRKMLLEYAEKDLKDLEENDQRFLREIVTKQVNDLA